MQERGFSRCARFFRWLKPSNMVLAILFVAVAFVGTPGALSAQTGSIDPSQLLQGLLQNPNAGNLGGLGSTPAQNTNPLTLAPSFANKALLPPSRLEQIMSQRASVRLYQFGYDLVGTGQTVVVPQTGGVADNYILGPGDQIVVSFRGQESSEYTVSVARDGTVALPRLKPIPVAGHTLGEFRQQLSDAVKRSYVSTEAFASLSQLRQVSVIVAGEVFIPGTRLVTGLSTPLDAILLSGGIKKTGSLRNIVILRGGRRITVDLYSLLTQRGGAEGTQTLTDGDKIIVPPIGRTVAISGWARNPGIFELASGSTQISTSALLRLAGGVEVRGRYRLSVLRVDANGGSTLVGLPSSGGVIRDSEILFVQPGADQTQKNATLSGDTALAGQYSVGRATSLGEMLKAPGALGQNPYTLFGVVSRRDSSTMLRRLVPITPIAVVRGSENMALLSDDIVRVFSNDENRLLTAVVDAFILRRQAAEQALRAPTSADLYAQPPALPPSSSSGSGNSNGNTTVPKIQPNPPPNPTPNTERQDIAQLSVETLGDGGLLTDNPPANGYSPYSSVAAAQQNQQNQQNLASPQQTLPSAQSVQGNPPTSQQTVQILQQPQPQTLQQLQLQSQLLSSQSQSNLPPNMELQQIRPGQVPTNEEAQTFGQLARQLNVDPLVLVHFLMDRAMSVDGAVHGAGRYFVGPSVSLQDLVSAAGGTSEWADSRGVELVTTEINSQTSTARTTHQLLALNDPSQASRLVRPHDEVRLHQIDTVVNAGSVTLQGQVRYPGTYQVQRGERLSELLLRAGGLTEVAYPYGTVFLRKSAADIERQSYVRAARDLENQVAAGVTLVGSDKTPPQALSEMQAFIYELRTTTPLGRISVVADPAVLASDPSRDVLLEDGDVIYLPQRSSTVSVMGEVLQPGAFPFTPSLSGKDYISRAGGYSQFADNSLVFVVLPDGTARQLQESWFDLEDQDIPPGSTIVVPRDAAILDTRQIILDITGIFRDLAVGAASLAVISRN